MPHRRTYETDSIRVHWDSSRCIHTGICLRRLPAVFDVQARPWVDLGGADADAVADAVGRCPTGALRYERLDGAEQEQPNRPTVVLPIENGPLLMAGDLDVRLPDGEQIAHDWPAPNERAADEPTSIVPLEDASLELRGHLRIYRSDGKPLAEVGHAVLCRCGRSRNKPFCDDSHRSADFRSQTPDPPRDRLEAETPAAFTPNPNVPQPPR